MMVLNNAIRVLMNHVPYDQEEFTKYEFISNNETALKLFMDTNNWL